MTALLAGAAVQRLDCAVAGLPDPATVALMVAVWPPVKEAVVGDTETDTDTDCASVTVAVAVLVGSAVAVAVTVTVVGGAIECAECGTFGATC